MNHEYLLYGDSLESHDLWTTKREKEILIEHQYLAGEILLPEGMKEPPEWVRKIYRIIYQKTNPSILESIQAIYENPKNLESWGYLGGITQSIRDVSHDQIDLAAEEIKKEFSLSNEQIEQFKHHANIKNHPNYSEKLIDDVLVSLQKITSQLPNLKSEQTQAFLKGYSKGLEYKFKYTDHIHSTDKITILSSMWLIWPWIVKYKNIPQVHAILNSRLKYQATDGDSMKRLENYCREIGLTLAPRGRPKKS